jgi:6-phosphogluconolactonase
VNRSITVVDDPAAAAAEKVADVVGSGGHIALAGGSTPRKAYRLLDEIGLAWGATELWLGDDRCVPPDHEHSNFRMISEELLAGIPDGKRPRDVHRIKGELRPSTAADDYVTQLREAFGADVEVPVLDLILLGIGPDAHTASLFPGDDALGEQERWVVGVETPGMAPLVPRVTLTLPVLEAAREVVFLIAGADKAAAVARAFGDAPGPDAPASLVRPHAGQLTVLLDTAAAARLEAA